MEPVFEIDVKAQRGRVLAGALGPESTAERTSGSAASGASAGVGQGHGAETVRLSVCHGRPLMRPAVQLITEHLAVDLAGAGDHLRGREPLGQLASAGAHALAEGGVFQKRAEARCQGVDEPASTTSPLSPWTFTTEVAVPSSVLTVGTPHVCASSIASPNDSLR